MKQKREQRNYYLHILYIESWHVAEALGHEDNALFISYHFP